MNFLYSDTDWAKKMCDSQLEHNPVLNSKWAYDFGVVFKGMEMVWKRTKDDRYWDYILKFVNSMIDDDGNITTYNPEMKNIDYINNGKILFSVYNYTKNPKYKKALDLQRSQFEIHPRTSEGGFWHKQVYPHQMWLDGLYMGAPFYAQYIKEYDDPKLFDDVTKQFLLMYKHSLDEKTGLLYHAWDESKSQFWANPETGCSANFWGRAMGWYCMALVDVLDYIPQDHKDRAEIITILQNVLDALIKVQDEKTGVWYQVLDKGNLKDNYLEASVSNMVMYAMAKAVNQGYISQNYIPVIEKAANGIIENFIRTDENNPELINLIQVCAVAGLGGKNNRDGSYEYYVHERIQTNDFKGVGAFILAFSELDKLLNIR